MRQFLRNTILLILFVLLLVMGSYVFFLFGKGEKDFPFQVQVKLGNTWEQVAEQLICDEILNNKKLFIISVYLLGAQNGLKAGEFEIRKNWSIFSIIRHLQNGSEKYHSITIPEGWDLSQIALEIERIFEIPTEEFLEECNSENWKRYSPNQTTALGFLFPETYSFSKNISVKQIVNLMNEQFENKVNALITNGIKSQGLTLQEGIIIASIVQGEIIQISECSQIASVYLNRLKKGMKLQADPTIQFIVSGPPRRLYQKDLQIQSAYNTYINYGLPPAPINNPGLDAIKAIAFPDSTEYLYFVARGDGYHEFSHTLREHNQAIQKFRKK